MASGGKRVVLSLKRKIDLMIEAIENGQKQKNAASDFGISANTVSGIMKLKERYKEELYSGEVGTQQFFFQRLLRTSDVVIFFLVPQRHRYKRSRL